MIRLLCKSAVALAIVASAQGAGATQSAAVERLAPKAFVYVPPAVHSPASLVVLLHGSGGNAREFIGNFRRDAEDRGILLLSVQSEGRTWPQRAPGDDESDVVNIKSAIRDLSARTSIDQSNVTVMGFSDGASYALSLGMAYPDLFHTIVAFSPGYAFAPKNLDTEQRIFISHSRRDPVLPAENTRPMIESLQRAGFAPEVHWFNGGHEIDPQLKKAAFDFALKP